MNLSINQLTVNNFGIFQGEYTFNFENGINLIKAENGHGKSTLISAIEMLLLDNYSDPYETYINNKSNFFKLAMEFNWDSENYKTILECKKAKSVTTNRVLLKDDMEIANGEEVKSKMAEMINPDIGKYALTVKQKEKDSVTRCKDSERRDLFKQVKNLNYDKQIDFYLMPKLDATKNDIIQTDKEIYAIENYSYKDLGIKPSLLFTESEYKDKQNNLDKLKLEKSLVEEKEKQIKEKKDSSNLKKIEKAELVSQVNSNENQIKSKSVQINEDENSLSYLGSDENKNIKLNILKSDYENEIADIKSKSEEKTIEYKNQKKDKENILEEKKKQFSNIKLVKLVKFPQESLDTPYANMLKTETYLFSINSNIEKLASGICPICGNPTTDKCHDLEKEKEQLELDYSIYKKDYEVALSKKKDYEESKEKNEHNKELKNQLEHEVIMLETDISNYDTLIAMEETNLQSKLGSTEKEYNSRIANFNSTHNEILQNLKDKLQSEKESLDFILKTNKELNNRIDNLQKEIDLLDKEINSYSVEFIDTNLISSLESELKLWNDTKKEIELYEKEEKEIAKLKKSNNKKLTELKDKKEKLVLHQKEIESARAILTKEFPNWVIDNSIQNVQDAMNNFINEVYYKPLNLSFKSTKTSIKLEFGENEKRMLPCSKLSGCEQKLTDIAFINNFNRLLGLNTIILDEPDAPLDDKRKETLYDSLLNMSKSYQQLFIITHSERMCNSIMAQTNTNMIML